MIPAASLPMAPGGSSSIPGVMTNAELTAAVMDLGMMVAGIHSFLLGPQPPPPPTAAIPTAAASSVIRRTLPLRHAL